MVLVDTSVWIEFFRQKNAMIDKILGELLEAGDGVALSAVFGELLQGAKNERETKVILEFWQSLPKVEESALFIEAGKISHDLQFVSKGVGLVDSYILAACQRSKLFLWTLDKKLSKAYSGM